MYLLAAAGAALVVIVQVARGRSVFGIFGAYQAASSSHYSVGDVTRWFLYHVSELDLSVGVLPFAALSCSRSGAAAGCPARRRLLVAATIAVTLARRRGRRFRVASERSASRSATCSTSRRCSSPASSVDRARSAAPRPGATAASRRPSARSPRSPVRAVHRHFVHLGHVRACSRCGRPRSGCTFRRRRRPLARRGWRRASSSSSPSARSRGGSGVVLAAPRLRCSTPARHSRSTAEHSGRRSGRSSRGSRGPTATGSRRSVGSADPRRVAVVWTGHDRPVHGERERVLQPRCRAGLHDRAAPSRAGSRRRPSSSTARPGPVDGRGARRPCASYVLTDTELTSRDAGSRGIAKKGLVLYASTGRCARSAQRRRALLRRPLGGADRHLPRARRARAGVCRRAARQRPAASSASAAARRRLRARRAGRVDNSCGRRARRDAARPARPRRAARASVRFRSARTARPGARRAAEHRHAPRSGSRSSASLPALVRIAFDVSPLSHEPTGIGNYIRGSLAALVEAAGGRARDRRVRADEPAGAAAHPGGARRHLRRRRSCGFLPVRASLAPGLEPRRPAAGRAVPRADRRPPLLRLDVPAAARRRCGRR